MKVQFKDFNCASDKIPADYATEWRQLEHVLQEMPLHVKASDQAGIQGSLIFDPVGTNAFIKERLAANDWKTNQAIPDNLSFLGTDVDFVKKGLLLEAQFSNYPFLLNNVVRSELFSKAKLKLDTEPINVLVVITKAHMFPASNSTLYYEQALNQLDALAENRVFDIPVRVVGLFEDVGAIVSATRTTYASKRYSRTVNRQTSIRCRINEGKKETSRCVLQVTRS